METFSAVSGMMYQEGEALLEESYWEEPRLSSTEADLSMELTGAALQPLSYYQDQDNVSSPEASMQFQGFPGLLDDPPLDIPLSSLFNVNFPLSGMSEDWSHPGHSQDGISDGGASQDGSLHFPQDNSPVCQTTSSCLMAEVDMAQGTEQACDADEMTRKPHARTRTLPRKAAQATPDPVPERKRTAPINPAYTIRKSRVANTVQQHPYRDRVIHLLALKNYKKQELLVRLQKDGIPPSDKNSLGTILHQVADLNPIDSSYSLKDEMFKELQRDWPGYSELDKQSLEMVLSRKATGIHASPSLFNFSLNNTVSLSQAQLYESPSRRKKVRISHMAALDQSAWKGPSNKGSEKAAVGVSPPSPAAASPSTPKQATPRPPTPPHHGWPSGSAAPETQDARGSRSGLKRRILKPQRCNCSDLEPAGSLSQPTKNSRARGKRGAGSEKCKGKPAVGQARAPKHNTEVRKTRPEKQRQAAKARGSEAAKAVPQGSEEPALSEDYLTDYGLIVSAAQRQRYEQDFKADFDEYQVLYAKMLALSAVFIKLDSKRKQLSPGSKAFQDINRRISLEYEKMKRGNPNYNAEKYRCKYLYNKLVHIKKLVTDYDQKQIQRHTVTSVQPE